MAAATRDGPRRFTSTAVSRGASKATVAAECTTTSHEASTRRPSSSRSRPVAADVAGHGVHAAASITVVEARRRARRAGGRSSRCARTSRARRAAASSAPGGPHQHDHLAFRGRSARGARPTPYRGIPWPRSPGCACLPARRPRRWAQRLSRLAAGGSAVEEGVVTSATLSVYHMVDGWGEMPRTPTQPALEGGTADRILDAALASFGSRGYEATSLDALAESLGVRKQSILYWFPSKEALLEALIDRSAGGAGHRPRGLAGAGRLGLGAGRGGGALGLPPGVAPARAARPAARGGPSGAAVGHAAHARARAPGAAGVDSSCRTRWTPATCAGTSRACCCWRSTPPWSG